MTRLKQQLIEIKSIHCENAIEMGKYILKNRDYIENLPKESTWDTRRLMRDDFYDMGLFNFNPVNGVCENLHLYPLTAYKIEPILGYVLKEKYIELVYKRSTDFSFLTILSLLFLSKRCDLIDLIDTVKCEKWAYYPIEGATEYYTGNNGDSHYKWRKNERYEYVKHCVEVLEHFKETGEILGIEVICDKVEF